MENNSDRMGFALIALSVVAFVLLAVNGPLKSTVGGFFDGFKEWQTATVNGISETNKQDVTHTAYSWSADGTDRFTTTKPNLNLLNKSRIYSKSNPYVLSGSGVDYYTWLNDISTYLKAGTYTLNAQTDGVWVDHVSTTNPNDKGVSLFVVGYTTGFWVSLGKTSPKTITIPSDGQYTIRVNLYSDGTTNVSRKFWDFKLEEGSTATPWMPSASEVKPSDQPKYIGTYTDKNETASKKPSDYTWKLNPDYHE